MKGFKPAKIKTPAFFRSSQLPHDAELIMKPAKRKEMNSLFRVEQKASNSKARAGILTLGSRTIQTPIFMPVATRGSLRHLPTPHLEALDPPILLTNTYHLLLQPGLSVLKQFGGLKNFCGHNGAFLTDSGGFQIFSLPGSRTLTEEGAEFRSFLNGDLHQLTPEFSLQIQDIVGSDIHMVLDVCVPSTSDKNISTQAMHRTHRWAERSIKFHQESKSPSKLFGIVQGACFEDLRKESAQTLASMEFDGLAIGGLAVGETKAEREHFTDFTTNFLPEHKPRYLMGVGTPIDLLEAVHRGIDMFDCILPTALAEQGVAFGWTGRMRLLRGVYESQNRPLGNDCHCPACRKYSRAFIHHLVSAGESVGTQLIAAHNTHFYFELIKCMRNAILSDDFLKFYNSHKTILGNNDLEFPIKEQKSRRTPLPKPESLGEFSIYQNKNNYWTIKHVPSGELFHGNGDPNIEARQIYGGVVAESLKNPESKSQVIVWDLGLGAAFNSVAAINAYEEFHIQAPAESKEAHPRLEIWSFDNSLNPLRLALNHIEKFPHLKRSGPRVLMDDGIWHSKHLPLTWTFKEVDLWKYFFHEDSNSDWVDVSKPDIVFFDPFSINSQPEAWNLRVFQNLKKRLLPNAKLVTYTSNQSIRRSLEVAGFNCQAGPPNIFGRPSTVAMPIF